RIFARTRNGRGAGGHRRHHSRASHPERGVPRGVAPRARPCYPYLMGFRAPVRDIALALFEVTGLKELLASGAFPNLDSETCLQILNTAGAFSETVLAPLNRSADLEGTRVQHGRVGAPTVGSRA